MADSVELPASVAEPSNSNMVPRDSVGEPEFAGEMEIIVQLGAVHNYVLLADGDNTVEDVLVEILGPNRAAQAPEPRLYFNDLELEKQKTLADCGIKLGSVLQLKCTPRVLSAHIYESLVKFYHNETNVRYVCNFPSPGEIAEMVCAESSSSMRPSGDGEMKIYVQSEYYGNYALEADSSNTIEHVLVTVLPIHVATTLYFNGRLLDGAKSLADYGIEDGSILHLKRAALSFVPRGRVNMREGPNVISGRKKITITDKPLAIWEKKHDKVLLSLLVEQISNGQRKNILYGGKDLWCNIVAKFNESTDLKYEYKHLFERFNFYEREYRIVNSIRHHPKFSWDHRRQVVIATDADWNEYIKQNHDARPYRRRAIPYVHLLEILFANTEV